VKGTFYLSGRAITTRYCAIEYYGKSQAKDQ